MIPSSQASATSGAWRKFAALLLVVAVLGLPLNDLFRCALLLIAAVAAVLAEKGIRAHSTTQRIVTLRLVDNRYARPPLTR